VITRIGLPDVIISLASLTCHPGRDSGRLPPTKLQYRRRQTGFPVSGASFWNSLPSHVTSAPWLATFRYRLKTFLFRLSYPDLIICFAHYFVQLWPYR